MIKMNENFFNLTDNYLFAKVLEKTNTYKANNPNAKIINLGIGDVTLPIVHSVIDAMHNAVDEMANIETFKGYGLVQGYSFLKEKIAQFDYKDLEISADEIFISDGAKCDLSNILDLFSKDITVGITDPVYPVYRDTNIIDGRNNIIYLNATEENGFVPQIPNEKIDLIYLCCPNNPTGTVFTKEQLTDWVNYALEHKSIILFDSVYESFITEDNIPHSIYEIPGSHKVAIEFRSFSKLAGFTGLRCSYLVVPKQLKIFNTKNEEYILHTIWTRRQATKFGGVSYITQRGAEAIYSEQGQKEIHENIKYYLENAKYIKWNLQQAGFTVFGGTNSPYIWLKVPQGITSWEFFDKLLEKANVVGTPGVGFGKCGEGYFRITAFGSKENTIEAVNRIINIF